MVYDHEDMVYDNEDILYDNEDKLHGIYIYYSYINLSYLTASVRVYLLIQYIS